MGMLINGQWQGIWYPTEETKGQFIRSATQFRSWITSDDAVGSNRKAEFKAEGNRHN